MRTARAPWADAPSRPSALDSRIRLPVGPPPLRPLTTREKQVADLLACGAIHKEIAHDLGISYFTVKNHLQRLKEALGVQTSREIAAVWLGAVPYSQRPKEPR